MAWKHIAVAVLLVLSYFTHPMPTAFAIGSIGLLSLVRRTGSDKWKTFAAMIPASLLLVWFIRTQGAAPAPDARAFAQRTHALLATVASFVVSARVIPTGSTVLPLVFGSPPFLQHAFDYAATERELVDLNNFEPATGYFPIRYRPGAEVPDRVDIEAQPEKLVLERYAPLRPAFDFRYERVAPNVYRRLSTTTIVLPFAGTAEVLRTATGAIWRVDQEIRLDSDRAATILANGHELALRPHALHPIVTDQRPPYVAITAATSVAPSLRYSTTLRRTDTGLPLRSIRSIRAANRSSSAASRSPLA